MSNFDLTLHQASGYSEYKGVNFSNRRIKGAFFGMAFRVWKLGHILGDSFECSWQFRLCRSMLAAGSDGTVRQKQQALKAKWNPFAFMNQLTRVTSGVTTCFKPNLTNIDASSNSLPFFATFIKYCYVTLGKRHLSFCARTPHGNAVVDSRCVNRSNGNWRTKSLPESDVCRVGWYF